MPCLIVFLKARISKNNKLNRHSKTVLNSQTKKGGYREGRVKWSWSSFRSHTQWICFVSHILRGRRREKKRKFSVEDFPHSWPFCKLLSNDVGQCLVNSSHFLACLRSICSLRQKREESLFLLFLFFFFFFPQEENKGGGRGSAV